MANITGYRSVIEAGTHFERFFTGQITAAGKIPPAKILVIGAGVAGPLWNCSITKGHCQSFDVRPEVAEQIESMGAEFLFLILKKACQMMEVMQNPLQKNLLKRKWICLKNKQKMLT